jgi:hypothetical protein
MATGITSKPPAKKAPQKKKASGPNYTGLSKNQNKIIGQRETGDIALGNAANAQLGGVASSYAQPIDYSQLPTTPWAQGQDLKGLTQNYQDQVYQDFARNADPQFQKQQEDFEQMAAERGWTPGSKLYDRQKKSLLDTQEGQRQSIRTQALQNSSAYGQTWNDIGTQNYSNAYQDVQNRRNQPLADYNALNAARSGMDMQNLGYSQARAMQAAQPRGGGGGGGAGAAWQQYGFKSPQEYDAYRTAQSRSNQQWEWDNAPKGAKGPSYGAQVGGQVLGTGLGLLGMYAGNNWF